MPILHVNTISCAYERETVVHDISFSIEPGQGACLLGPSGCGKTTILRAIAGFEPVTSGEIKLRDHLISSPSRMMPPEKRKVGMVFQDYALFPHLTNEENIAFGLMKHPNKEKQVIVSDMLALVGLTDAAKKYPHELSGGQQQRIALARALAPGPDLLLLDEPFSNLDTTLRKHLNNEVKNILKLNGTAFLLVTHDQDEAFAMSDYVGVLEKGRMRQWDTPFNLYHRPADPKVAAFIGEGQIINACVVNNQCVDSSIGHICSRFKLDVSSGDKVKVLLRPDDFVPDQSSERNVEVVDKAFKGAVTLYHLRYPDGTIVKALFPSHYDYQITEKVGVRIEADHLVLFEP